MVFQTVAAADAPRRFFCFSELLSESTIDQLPAEISCRELQLKLAQGQSVLLLDCREQHEYDLVKMEGATLLPMSQLAERQAELAGLEHQQTVVYCHLGMRSQRVAAWLREHGFSNVQSLAGGIDAWAAEIDPGMVRY